VFEREVIKGFIHMQQIELYPQFMTQTQQKDSPGLLKLSRVERIFYFDREGIPLLPTSGCQLLKPKSQIFKAWDFIIEDAHTKKVIFVGTSTLFPDKHDVKDGSSKIAKSFVAEKNGQNQIERILDSIFQKTESKASIKDGSFIIKLHESLGDWEVKFLCVTTHHDEELKSRSWGWKDVLVAGRETLKPLKLLFSRDCCQTKPV